MRKNAILSKHAFMEEVPAVKKTKTKRSSGTDVAFVVDCFCFHSWVISRGRRSREAETAEGEE